MGKGLLLLAGLLFLWPAVACVGQPTVGKPAVEPGAGSPESLEGLQESIDALDKRIASSLESENSLTAQQIGVSLEKLAERTQALEALRSAQERLKAEIKNRSVQAKEATLLKEKLQDPKEARVTDTPPYNLSFYDGLLDELSAIEQQRVAASVARGLSRRQSDNLSARLEKAQQRARSKNEQLENKPETAQARVLAYDLLLAGIETELLSALISFERVHRENLSDKIDLLQLEADIARKKIEWVATHLHYDESDLQRHLETIRKKQKKLESELQGFVNDRDKIEVSLHRARQQLSEAKNGSLKTLEAKVRELQAWRERYQVPLELTATEIQVLEEQQRLWKTRYSVAEGDFPRAELIKLREEIESQLTDLDNQIGLEHRRRDAIRSRVGLLQNELENPEIPASVKPLVEGTIDALRQLAEVHSDHISALLADQQLRRRILEETAPQDKAASIKDNLLAWSGRLKAVWSFEVWVIDNNPVTVREVVVALLVLVIGIIVVKLVFRKASRKIFALANLKKTTAATITKIFLYFAYVMVALLALRIVNIPLAAFAFLGGAIAIGVGFGAQNLINNFISGFIMMAERPIAIGDLIEVDGILGKVEDIGARSTCIRTGRNIHILVPNSSFLENNIINWTHSDEKIRAQVTVGVAYGSSVADTRRLLLQAVRDTPDTFQSPAPFVIFEDFGDNALIFEVHFWVRINRPTEQRIIESNVRFQIDKLFAESGLVIAFPQRDVHFDSSKPLELRISRSKKPEN